MESDETMVIDKPFVLPADVFVIPVGTLTSRVRASIRCDDGDFAITRSGSRTPSRIVNAEMAGLLEEFREPTSLVDAIIRFSRKQGQQPARTLEDAFEALQTFCNTKVLVLAESNDAHILTASFAVGQAVSGYEVLRRVQVLEDSELYQARTQTGMLVALKVLRPGYLPITSDMIDREAAILRYLAGERSPHFVEYGTIEDLPYLVTQWCFGVPVTTRAQKFRAHSAPGSRDTLHRLCCSILEAYQRLHDRGVIHGDVHPGNIIVHSDGAITVIDYGFAHFLDPDSPHFIVPRVGVGFFYEPELAYALLNSSVPPAATVLGEQYALAALLYLLITGDYYIAFSAEQEMLFRQIIEDKPLPFIRRGFKPWTEVEAVLNRALSKNPKERFPSIKEFLAAFQKAAPSQAKAPEHGLSLSRETGRDLLKGVLEKIDLDGSMFTSGIKEASRTAVAFSSAGVAWFLYRLSLIYEDPSLLARADAWAVRTPIDESCYDKALGITPKAVGTVSPLYTVSGVHCIRALIGHARGDERTQNAEILAFLQGSNRNYENPELITGRSGFLIACSLLLDSLSGTARIDRDPLIRLTHQISRSLCHQLEGWKRIGECLEVPHLGIAHGWAGILYAVLRACRSSGIEIPTVISVRLNELASWAQSFGRGVAWKGALQHHDQPNTSSEYVPGWCSGSAGFIHLWVLAHDVYHDERYLKLAERSAWYTWEHPDSCVNLCCGLAGRAFGLLRLYQYTGAVEWLNRARHLEQRGVALNEEFASLPMSLYRGQLGMALLVAEIQAPEMAAMPLFSSEGWPNTMAG